MKFDYSKIPFEMKKERRWCLWKLSKKSKEQIARLNLLPIEKRKNGDEYNKIPINAITGLGAKSNDPSSWCSFEECLEGDALWHCTGLGFFLGDGWSCIDLDHIDFKKPTQLLADCVALEGTYQEVSTSGQGIHIIGKWQTEFANKKLPEIENYESQRFIALTGIVEPPARRCDLDIHFEFQSEFVRNQIFRKYITAPEVKEIPLGAYVFTRESNAPIFETDTYMSESDVIQVARSSQKGSLFDNLYRGFWDSNYPSQSEADIAFAGMLAFYSRGDLTIMENIFRSSGLMRDKFDRKTGKSTYGKQLLEKAVKSCTNFYTPPRKVESSVKSIRIADVQKQNEAERTKIKIKYTLTDSGNAQRFTDVYKDIIRYNVDNQVWYIWNGKHWKEDVEKNIKLLLDKEVEEMRKEALECENEFLQKALNKNVNYMMSAYGKTQCLKESQHQEGIPVHNSHFDTDSYALNCNNGIVDLRTGKLREHNPDEMHSKIVSVDYIEDAPAPIKWLKFLNEVFSHDSEMVDFIQRAVGYSFTGSTKEEVLFECYGDGANGKSVFFNVMYELLGDYIINTQIASIIQKGNMNTQVNTDIARMSRARFVRTNEPDENQRLAEGLVKQLVSGDTTTARFLYGREFDFKPVFKLWIACNHKLIIRGVDSGIWRRIIVVPFLNQFTEEKGNVDKDLFLKLRDELPSILKWAIDGTVKWLESGLEIPELVKIHTTEYKKSMDIITYYIDERLILSKDNTLYREKAGDVYTDYSRWAKDGNEYVMNQTKFGMEMSKKFNKTKVGGYMYYIGIKLKTHDDRYIYEENNERGKK